VRLTLMAAILTLCCATPARAELMTIAFSGSLTGTWEFLPAWFPGIEEGDSFSGSLTYDPLMAQPFGGSMSVTIEGYEFTSRGFLSTPTYIGSGGRLTAPHVTGVSFVPYFLEIYKDPVTFNGAQILWTGLSNDPRYPNAGESGWTGTITSFTVPEPATLWLLAIGVVGVVTRRIHQKHA
jgi:PEP-CTERM motif